MSTVQQDIHANMRGILVDWLVEVALVRPAACVCCRQPCNAPFVLSMPAVGEPQRTPVVQLQMSTPHIGPWDAPSSSYVHDIYCRKKVQ